MLDSTPLGGKVALYVMTDSGFQIMQEFTLDYELIRTKVAGLWGQVPAPVGMIDQAEAASHEAVHAFQDIAKHLSGISGQKVLIWVSTGFPLPSPQPGLHIPPGALKSPDFGNDVDTAVHLLGNANVVVESTIPSYLGAHLRPELGPVSFDANAAQHIAERTGGRFFPADTINDLAGTFRTAANDRATSYELGYYAGDNLPPGLQTFEIRCKRPGITLRYREGYYIEKKPPASAPDARAAGQETLEGAVDAVTIPLTAQARRTAGNVGSIVLHLNVDAKALTLRQAGEVWRANISTMARFASGVEDQMGVVPLDAPALNLTPAQHDKAMRDGINLHFQMKIPAGAVSLRVLVRDGDSGNTGTVTIPLDDLPEL